jgi:hypothetical protein
VRHLVDAVQLVDCVGEGLERVDFDAGKKSLLQSAFFYGGKRATGHTALTRSQIGSVQSGPRTRARTCRLVPRPH